MVALLHYSGGRYIYAFAWACLGTPVVYYRVWAVREKRRPSMLSQAPEDAVSGSSSTTGTEFDLLYYFYLYYTLYYRD